MSLGSWDPNIEAKRDSVTIDADLLSRFIAASADEKLETIDSVLSQDEQALYSSLMAVPMQTWQDAVSDLDEASIYHLMRFLTVAEMHYAGWEANENSPVIWLNKVLKKRKLPLAKEQIRWIKANSNNRFLPNGPIL